MCHHSFLHEASQKASQEGNPEASREACQKQLSPAGWSLPAGGNQTGFSPDPARYSPVR